ncbi:hypothetical protein ACFX13_045044 [Malus domestica]
MITPGSPGDAWRLGANKVAPTASVIALNSFLTLAESSLNLNKGEKFILDLGLGSSNQVGPNSPGYSLRESGDFGYELWPFCVYIGFVMSVKVEGEGRWR